MSELQTIGTPMQNVVTEKTVMDFLTTSESKLSMPQKQLFLQMALRHNLDPFKREIYAIAYGSEFSLVTGYEVYIKRADASGKLSGWSCVNTEEGAKLTIYRKDWQEPFEWEASYDEFDKKQGSWNKMRKFMIKKVCIGQGFRLAFPEALGGLLYVEEEMKDAVPFKDEKPDVKKTQRKSDQKKTTKKDDGPEEEALICVKSVAQKVTKNNPKYIIYSYEDVAYSTFDQKIADEAKKIEGSEVQALVIFTSGQWGNTIKTFTVTSEVPMEEEGPPLMEE